MNRGHYPLVAQSALLDPPTWISLLVSGLNLVGSFSHNSPSLVSRYQLWQRLSSETENAAVLVPGYGDGITSPFAFPYNLPSNQELLGGNRGFEEPTLSEWRDFSGTGVYSSSTAYAHGGARSLKYYYSATGAIPGTVTFDSYPRSIGVIASSPYTLSVWIKILINTDPSNILPSLMVSFYDSAGGALGGTLSSALSGAVADWHQISLSGNSPANAAFARVSLYFTDIGSGSRTVEAYWDDSSLVGQSPISTSYLYALKAINEYAEASLFSAWLQPPPPPSAAVFIDQSDPTRQLQHSAANISTATLRSVTWQDKDITVAGTDDIATSIQNILMFQGEPLFHRDGTLMIKR